MRLMLCVFLGSGLGGVLRYGVSRLIPASAGVFPWATLIVNLVGCFLIGLIYGAVDSGVLRLDDSTKLFITTGLCGGLTTFSTFTHENYLLFQAHAFGTVALYAGISLLAGFICAWLGHASVGFWR